MRINYWKVATIILVGIWSWLAYSGRSVAAQYGLNGQTYNITRTTATSGTISVPGAVMGFSCASDVQGDLSKGDGQITSDVTCYVLSK